MRSISKNYFYNLSYQILTLITPFITTPYIARVLGADGVGEYSFTYSMVAYFVLIAQFGITNYAQREIAYHQDDKVEQSKIFFEVIIFQILTVSISLISYYLSGKIFNVASLIYWVQALNIIAILFDVSWFFQGLEEFGKIVFRNFVVRLINIGLLFAFVKSHDDLILYTLIMGGMNIFSGLFVCLFLKDYIHRVPLVQIHPLRNWIPILQLFLPQIAIQIYVVLNKTMLGFFSDSYTENGYYEQADKIIKLLLTIATALGTVMLPRIASTVSRGDMKLVHNYIMKSYQFSFFLTIPLCLGLVSTASNFVPWFFGSGYSPVSSLLAILSSIVIAVGLSNVTGIQFMVPMNRQNQLTMSVIIGAIFNFLINIYLVPRFYSLGVAISAVFTEWLVTMVQFYLVRDFFSIRDILVLGKNYLFSGVAMFIVTEFLGNQLFPSILHSILIIFAGIVTYLVVLWAIKDEVTLLAVNKVKQFVVK